HLLDGAVLKEDEPAAGGCLLLVRYHFISTRYILSAPEVDDVAVANGRAGHRNSRLERVQRCQLCRRLPAPRLERLQPVAEGFECVLALLAHGPAWRTRCAPRKQKTESDQGDEERRFPTHWEVSKNETPRAKCRPGQCLNRFGSIVEGGDSLSTAAGAGGL